MAFSVRKRKAFEILNGDSLGSIADFHGKNAISALLIEALDNQAVDSTMVYEAYEWAVN